MLNGWSGYTDARPSTISSHFLAFRLLFWAVFARVLDRRRSWLLSTAITMRSDTSREIWRVQCHSKRLNFNVTKCFFIHFGRMLRIWKLLLNSGSFFHSDTYSHARSSMLVFYRSWPRCGANVTSVYWAFPSGRYFYYLIWTNQQMPSCAGKFLPFSNLREGEPTSRKWQCQDSVKWGKLKRMEQSSGNLSLETTRKSISFAPFITWMHFFAPMLQTRILLYIQEYFDFIAFLRKVYKFSWNFFTGLKLNKEERPLPVKSPPTLEMVEEKGLTTGTCQRRLAWKGHRNLLDPQTTSQSYEEGRYICSFAGCYWIQCPQCGTRLNSGARKTWTIVRWES